MVRRATTVARAQAAPAAIPTRMARQSCNAWVSSVIQATPTKATPKLSLKKSKVKAGKRAVVKVKVDGKGKVVSSPRVVTADQNPALIEQGVELPYQVATSSGATSIAFRKANLKLEVTPQITPEGNIILTLDVNKDTVGQPTTAGFAINTKHVQTEVLVENGGTVVIGGIFELTESNDESRIPVLGEVPYLGALFRTRNRVAHKTEMLVFITPKMITDRNAAR